MSEFKAPPFATAPTAAPVAAPVAAAAPTAAPAAAAPAAAPKEKVKRERSATMISAEHIKFVRENVKTMSYADMASALGISRNQINRILQELKKMLRNEAIKRSGDQPAYAQKGTNKKNEVVWDYEQPLTEIAKKVEAKIESTLTRPEEARPGAGKGGGQVAAALSSEMADLLADLN